MIDNLFPCDISAFVTIQEAIMRLRTIGLISTLVLGLLAGPSQDLTQVGILLARLQAQFQLPLCRQSLHPFTLHICLLPEGAYYTLLKRQFSG